MSINIGIATKGGVAGGGTVSTPSGSNSNATGSTFVIVTIVNGGETANTPTDNFGNTYVACGTSQAGPSYPIAYVHRCENGAGGSNHAATNTYSAGKAQIVLIEIAGAAIASFDSGSLVQATKTGGSPFSITSNALAQAVELVLTIAALQSGSSNAMTSPDTTIFISDVDGATSRNFAIGRTTSASTAAITGTMNDDLVASACVMFIMGFKEAAALTASMAWVRA